MFKLSSKNAPPLLFPHCHLDSIPGDLLSLSFWPWGRHDKKLILFGLCIGESLAPFMLHGVFFSQHEPCWLEELCRPRRLCAGPRQPCEGKGGLPVHRNCAGWSRLLAAHRCFLAAYWLRLILDASGAGTAFPGDFLPSPGEGAQGRPAPGAPLVPGQPCPCPAV